MPTPSASVRQAPGIGKDREAICPSAVAALTRAPRRWQAATSPRVPRDGGCESDRKAEAGALGSAACARGEACGATSPSGLVNDPVRRPQADSRARSPWGQLLATFKGTICVQCV